MQTRRKEVGMKMRVNSSATVNCFRPRSSSLWNRAGFPGGLFHPNVHKNLAISRWFQTEHFQDRSLHFPIFLKQPSCSRPLPTLVFLAQPSTLCKTPKSEHPLPQHTFLSPPSTSLHPHLLNLCSSFLSSASYSRWGCHPQSQNTPRPPLLADHLAVSILAPTHHCFLCQSRVL